MAYMNREDRRASIVQATVALVRRDGLAAATVRAVAEALGASPGQVHHHFASAEALRAEAFRVLTAELGDNFRREFAPLPPRQQLYLLLLGDGGDLHAFAERLWQDSVAMAKDAPLVREALRAASEDWLDLLAQIVTAGREAGDFRPGDAATEVARRLAALCLGQDVLADMGIAGFGEEARRQRLQAMVAVELDSYALAGGAGAP